MSRSRKPAKAKHNLQKNRRKRHRGDPVVTNPPWTRSFSTSELTTRRNQTPSMSQPRSEKETMPSTPLESSPQPAFLNPSAETSANKNTTPSPNESQEKKVRKFSKDTRRLKIRPARLFPEKRNVSKGITPTEFSHFKKLPPELRNKIWGLVEAMSPRLVVIPQAYQVYPATAHVCSESRAFLYRNHQAFEDPEHENGPAIWVNVHLDTIYLDIANLREHAGTFASANSNSYVNTPLYNELLPYSKLLNSAKNVSLPIDCHKFAKLLAVRKWQYDRKKALPGLKPTRLVVQNSVPFWEMMAHFCPEVQVVHVVTSIWLSVDFDKEKRLQNDVSYLYSRLVKTRNVKRRGDVRLDLSAFWCKKKDGTKRSVTGFWVSGFYATIKEGYWFVEAPLKART